MKSFKKNQAGFSFFETVIAVFILAVGIMTVLSVVMSGLNASVSAKNHEVADQLAQEGVELVRNIRDNNWAQENASFSRLPAADNSDCRIDINMSDISGQCGAGLSKQLLLDASGFFSHSGATATRFSRKLAVSYLESGAKFKVISIVIWGANWPAGTIDSTTCNEYTKCTYTSTIFSKWGGSGT